MNPYASLADDFYVNMNLNTEMELSNSRETLLHFAEQMQRKYPEMRNFYGRDKGDFILEGDKDSGAYRWCSLEPRRVASGQVNPDNIQTAVDQHLHALELAPYVLSVSGLDCEALDFLMGFDFNYRGNHNALVAEAIGVPPGFAKATQMPGASFINFEPNLTFAVDEDCRVQCRLSVENRTTPYHIRTGEFQEDQLSVYVTARRYGSLDPGMTFVDAMTELRKLCLEVVDDYVAGEVLEPLARAIAME
ncbi:hypothetical protein Pla123a_41940 [Posidoniimonas polymericola]|uniref:Uncharacterized protein n=1 Tax=Posidoniimonas polymericola TaxID=2528002 RepID=A0A5C5XY71_9BACT|nr:hypothetical protein [Posidoniimonas polymericola]TWT67638.1 hypothetical protein Pla123a_41940 [Posidoniimonas polymericola]